MLPGSSTKRVPMQCSLDKTAALAPAWQRKPASAPLHGLPLHIVPPSNNRFRGRVVSEVAKRLGATLTSASSCSVCVVCQSPQNGKLGGTSRNHAAGVASNGGALGRRIACAPGAVIVTHAWVVHALQTAAQPSVDEFRI